MGRRRSGDDVRVWDWLDCFHIVSARKNKTSIPLAGERLVINYRRGSVAEVYSDDCGNEQQPPAARRRRPPVISTLTSCVVGSQ